MSIRNKKGITYLEEGLYIHQWGLYLKFELFVQLVLKLYFYTMEVV